MSTLSRNVIANMLAKAWIGVLNMIFVPYYLKYLGPESYGLVGVFTTIQSLFAFLDMGFSMSLNRQFARYSANSGQGQNMRDLLRTFESFYWLIAIGIGLFIGLASQFLANNWVRPNALSPHIVRHVVVLIGLTIAIQWPVSLYVGGLMGLQRQVLSNILTGSLWTLRAIGGFVAVRVTSDPLVSFFRWQLFISLCSVVAISLSLWRVLPLGSERPRFRVPLLKPLWRFAAGVTSLSLVLLLFNQIDKVLLSRNVTLAEFGYYSIAWQVLGAMYLLYSPLYSALFPVFASCVHANRQQLLADRYHSGCQLMSVTAFPVVLVIAAFAKTVVFVWTGSQQTADSTSHVLSILVVGGLFTALSYLAFAVQQAAGITVYGLKIFGAAFVLMLPLMIFGLRYNSCLPLACIWAGMNCVACLAGVYVTLTRFIPGHGKKWLLQDVLRPLTATAIIVAMMRIVQPNSMGRTGGALYLVCCLLSTALCAALVTPVTYRLLIGLNARAYIDHTRK